VGVVVANYLLLLLHGVPVESVLRELRRRFGTSGIDEKAARKKN